MSVTGKDEKPKVRPSKSIGGRYAPIVSTSKCAVGDEVVHPQFGDGTITDIEGDKLTINFADGRTKQILDYYVKRRRQ